MDGFDVWDTISIGKPSPRTEILLNIDLAPEEELNEKDSLDPPYQGAAIRVGDMKLLVSCPNSTWFRPPELGRISTNDKVSKITLVSTRIHIVATDHVAQRTRSIVYSKYHYKLLQTEAHHLTVKFS